jgi:hypothetical protein
MSAKVGSCVGKAPSWRREAQISPQRLLVNTGGCVTSMRRVALHRYRQLPYGCRTGPDSVRTGVVTHLTPSRLDTALHALGGFVGLVVPISTPVRGPGTLDGECQHSRGRTMRKKIAVGAGLVLLAVLVTVLAVLCMQPAGPPLQVGMGQEEVDRAMGKPGVNLAYSGYPVLMYLQGPDLIGNEQRVIVRFDREGRVADWSVTSSRTRPPWMDRAMKAVGW